MQLARDSPSALRLDALRPRRQTAGSLSRWHPGRLEGRTLSTLNFKKSLSDCFLTTAPWSVCWFVQLLCPRSRLQPCSNPVKIASWQSLCSISAAIRNGTGNVPHPRRPWQGGDKLLETARPCQSLGASESRGCILQHTEGVIWVSTSAHCFLNLPTSPPNRWSNTLAPRQFHVSCDSLCCVRSERKAWNLAHSEKLRRAR